MQDLYINFMCVCDFYNWNFFIQKNKAMCFFIWTSLSAPPPHPNLGPLSPCHVLGSVGHQVATGVKFSSSLWKGYMPLTGTKGWGASTLCHTAVSGAQTTPHSSCAGLWQTVRVPLLSDVSGEHQPRHGRPPGPTALAAGGMRELWEAAGKVPSSRSCPLD